MFDLKTKHDTDKSYLEKKISDTSGLVKKKTDYNAKITEIEGKIRIITGVTTTSALTAVENKIPDICGLVKKKKRDYKVKISDIESKCFTTLIMINLHVKHLLHRQKSVS